MLYLEYKGQILHPKCDFVNSETVRKIPVEHIVDLQSLVLLSLHKLQQLKLTMEEWRGK